MYVCVFHRLSLCLLNRWNSLSFMPCICFMGEQTVYYILYFYTITLMSNKIIEHKTCPTTDL